MSDTPDNLNATTEALAKILKRELVAVDAYEKAALQSSEPSDKVAFGGLQADHAYAASMLRNLLAQLHDLHDLEAAGSWGRFTRAAQDAANMLGRGATLATLRAGESHGMKLYHRAIDDRELIPQAHALLAEDLLPRYRSHLEVLDGLAA